MNEENQEVGRISEVGAEKDEARELTPEEIVHIRYIVSELRDPIREMLRPIMEKIERGGYQLLTGDDASGRIPALIVRTIINRVYKRHGHPKITTRFIAGTRHHSRHGPMENFGKKAKVSQYVRDLHVSMPDIKHALIVTDTIDTGRSLLPLAESLREFGISYDIATVGACGTPEDLKEVEERLSGNIYYGRYFFTPSIYQAHDISGVEKDRNDLHATPVRKNLLVTDPARIQKEIALARKEAKRVAKGILLRLRLKVEENNASDDGSFGPEELVEDTSADEEEWGFEGEERLAAQNSSTNDFLVIGDDGPLRDQFFLEVFLLEKWKYSKWCHVNIL